MALANGDIWTLVSNKKISNMRIAGYIDHPHFKITVFEVESKFLVKFEIGLFEQTYKLRKGEKIQSFKDIQHFITENFIQNVEEVFQSMLKHRNEALKSFVSAEDDHSRQQLI